MDHQTRLVEELDQSRETMRQVIAELDLKKEYYPGWSIQQVLAHITGWDEAVTASLRAFLAGGDAAIASYRGINEYNERSVETRGDLPYEHVRQEWELARDDLKASLRDIPAGRMLDEVLTPWGERGSIVEMVEIFIHHEASHAKELRELKNKA